MKALPALLLAVLAVLQVATMPLRAQSQQAAAANDAAYALFSSGDYTGAAAAYEKLLKDFPTDGVVPFALIQLAFSQYFLGNYDAAQATIAKALSGPPLTPEAREVVDNVLPQILAAKASSLTRTDPKRKSTFEDAIAKYTDFINKYPKSTEIENATFGRALSNFQIDNYAKAIEDLQSNIQKFAQSPTISTSKNLLALALATQGGQELAKPTPDTTKGVDLLRQGEKLLRQVIDEKKDVALINESYFQIGEILFTLASFSPEADRPAIFNQALDAYRSILPKEEVIALQQDKIKEFPSRKAAALLAKNAALKKQLDKENERALQKLAELQAKPDQIPTAVLKMGEIYFNAQKYNEARVLMGHVSPFLTTDDAKMRAAYFNAMTYALQNVADKAVPAYDSFFATYKGTPLAENLPFAMGSMFLSLGKPDEAIKYFDDSLTKYPAGRFAGLSVVSKAQAQAALKQFDSALQTFQTCLAKNPGPEIGVVAQYGLANILKDTSKWDEAIAAYKTTKEKYAGTPQATEADYWIAVCTQQKGDNAAAIPLLKAFADANATHPLAPLAIYALGGAQIALGQKQDGLTTLAGLAEKFPDSQPAPYTYFMRAQLLAGEQKADEVTALMRQFIEKYPKDDKIFFAYDTIAQNAVATSKPADAIASYLEFAERYPESPKATETIIKASALQRGQAEALATNFSSLNEAEQTQWKDYVQQSVNTIESLAAKYPDAPDLAQGLRSLLTSQNLLLKAQIKDPAAVESYFQGLADKTSSASAKSKILFTLAAFVSENDKTRALTMMNSAYSPDVVYAPEDIEVYGLALVDGKKFDEASAVFKKLAGDYPIPAGTAPGAAPTAVQEAQATALFGAGRVAQEQKQTAEAGRLFQQLKTLYPWSPKVLEADYGIAQSLVAAGKSDEAQPLLTAIIRAPNATAELRANSFLLLGQMMEEKKGTTTDPKEAAKFRDAAIDSYLKIAQFYGGVPQAASEGLWRGAQMLEVQVSESSDPKFKAQQSKRARDAYQQLLKDYPNSPHADKAKERVAALPAQ